MTRPLMLLCIAVLLVAPNPPARAADWNIALDSTTPTAPLSPNLLGQYDLSGDLLGYDQVSGLIPAMAAVGFSDWRIGLGRWEGGTWVLPTLTDGSPCPPAGHPAPSGAMDVDLIAARDWFRDDGQPVTLADTNDDARYDLAYVRAAIDVATAFGTTAFVSIDSMPSALAINTTPERTDCGWSFTNAVSNVRPADDAVFAAAVAGMVERVVEGHAGEPGRPVTHFEFWNEPELPQFWDPAFEDLGGPLDRWFDVAIDTLLALEAYRTSSSYPAAANLRFGLGSFASFGSAASTLTAFDSLPVPGGLLPIDFISFHGYSNEPLEIVAGIESVAAAAAATTHFQDIELVLGEWGSHLGDTAGDPVYHSSMAPALHVTTVLALGAAAGLDRAHHALFWNFLPNFVQLGLLANDLTPRPAYRAYELLAKTITAGAERIPPTGAGDGVLDAGLGAVLASRDLAGTTRVLFVNRNATARTTEVAFDSIATVPTRLHIFDAPGGGIVQQPGTTSLFTVPAESLVLAEFEPTAVPALGREAVVALAGVLMASALLRRRRLRRPDRQ